MKDPQGSPVQGRTRWRRFALMMVPATALAGAIVAGMANGAIAASMAVSGQTFKVKASYLDGRGFVQYGGEVEDKDGNRIPVAVSGITRADLHDLCQSVKVPGAPLVLTINAGGGGNPAKATNLMIDMDSLEGNATFHGIQIGRDAGSLDAGPDGAQGKPGAFGQQAGRVEIRDLRQVARRTTAGTFTLTGLKLSLKAGADAKECF